MFWELCWLAHKEDDCPLIKEHAHVLENIRISSRTMQREACNGQLRFEVGSYRTRNVFADGDCLFHAFAKEVQDLYTTSLPPEYVCSDTPEASNIIICFESESGKTAYWYHIAVMYWEPIRPTLVRLMTVDKIHAVDRVRLTHAHRNFSTHDELESDDDADEQAGQANCMWHLI